MFGVGSATPQRNRNPSAFLLSVDNEYVLIDCGEGTQFRFLEHKVKTSRIKTICISHLHGDHYFGLVGLLSTFSLHHRTEPLTLIGPEALLEIIHLQLFHSGSTLSFKLEFIATQNVHVSKIFENAALEIYTFPLIHRIPTTGFKLIQKASKRKIIKDILPVNFPIPYIKMLKEGKDVKDELTGEIFLNSTYTKEGNKAKVFSYCSDTAFNKDILPVIFESDLLYHEATFTDVDSKRAENTFHSTARQAALIAKEANVSKLLLGHFSSRYGNELTHLSEALEVFSNTLIAEQYILYTV